jgi:uridine phosphorylase
MARRKTVIKLEKPSYMGEHGAGSIIAKKGKWSGIPLLEDNKGKFPPFIIAVGDRRRADDESQSLTTAAKHLSFSVEVSQETLKTCNNKGRINVLVGFYESGGKKLPVAVVETQMGMPAQEINLQETLCLCDHTGYNFDSRRLETDVITAIRVGSCGGLNTGYGKDAKPPILKIGDLVVAEGSFGHSGAIYQRLGGLDYVTIKARKKILRIWKEMGLSTLRNFLYAKSDPEIVQMLISSSIELDQNAVIGRNFSKDSLYGEDTSLDDFIKLAKRYNAKSTEMEHLGIGYLAKWFTLRGIPVQHGLISAVVGALPEQSFYTNDEEKHKAENAESAAMKVALHAMWKMTYES